MTILRGFSSQSHQRSTCGARGSTYCASLWGRPVTVLMGPCLWRCLKFLGFYLTSMFPSFKTKQFRACLRLYVGFPRLVVSFCQAHVSVLGCVVPNRTPKTLNLTYNVIFYVSFIVCHSNMFLRCAYNVTFFMSHMVCHSDMELPCSSPRYSMSTEFDPLQTCSFLRAHAGAEHVPDVPFCRPCLISVAVLHSM